MSDRVVNQADVNPLGHLLPDGDPSKPTLPPEPLPWPQPGDRVMYERRCLGVAAVIRPPQTEGMDCPPTPMALLCDTSGREWGWVETARLEKHEVPWDPEQGGWETARATEARKENRDE